MSRQFKGVMPDRCRELDVEPACDTHITYDVVLNDDGNRWLSAPRGNLLESALRGDFGGAIEGATLVVPQREQLGLCARWCGLGGSHSISPCSP